MRCFSSHSVTPPNRCWARGSSMTIPIKTESFEKGYVPPPLIFLLEQRDTFGFQRRLNIFKLIGDNLSAQNFTRHLLIAARSL